MTVLIFLAVLVVLILVHEFGHFVVAKLFGIRVDEFGIGFPPRIFGVKRGETLYSINALPIGGFVRIYGEDSDTLTENDTDYKRSFITQPKLAQAAVLVAGVFMNVLLAWVLFVSGFLYGIPTALDESEVADLAATQVVITAIVPDSPAAAELKASDIIVGVHVGETTLVAPLRPTEIAALIHEHESTPVTIDIERRNELRSVTLTPQLWVLPEHPERAATGFTMSLTGIESLPFLNAIVEGTKMTGSLLWAIIVGFGVLLSDLIAGQADLSTVSGPVGIVSLVGDAASLGFAWLMTFTAFISLNLAVLNLLPLPALDGGRLLFVIIEAVKGSPIKPAVAGWMNRVGFAFLILLMLVVTVKDVLNLF